MNFKELKFGDNARAEIIAGINIVADAVKATMGPSGRNVVIKRKFTAPHITKDGVTVAKEIHLRDEFKDMGAQLALEASARTNELAGDGTSQTVVLTQAIVNQGLRYIDKGISSIEIKRGLDLACQHAVELIQLSSTPADTEEALLKIAKISANSDPIIATLIADAISVVGSDGIITVEKGGIKDELEVISGMRTSQGWINQHFLDGSGRLTIELSNPKVILIDKKLAAQDEIVRILEQLNHDKRSAILIAHDFSDEILALLATNLKKGLLNVIPVKADGFGERRTGILEDIAVYTGGVVFDSQNGESISTASVRLLGECDKISITREETAFIGGKGNADKVKARIDHIRLLLDDESNGYNIDKFNERLGALSRGVAVIKVGGYTEVEMKEKKDRVDDAICAVRAAVQEGTVPGAGMMLVYAAKSLTADLGDLAISEDQLIGYKILLHAMRAPFDRILTNAGLVPDVILADLDRMGEDMHLFNLRTRLIEDTDDSEVIDPAKVVRVALQNASSIAGLVLTTEVVIGFDGVDKTDNLGILGNQ